GAILVGDRARRSGDTPADRRIRYRAERLHGLPDPGVLGLDPALDEGLHQGLLGLAVVKHARLADLGFGRDRLQRHAGGAVAGHHGLHGVEHGVPVDGSIAPHAPRSYLFPAGRLFTCSPARSRPHRAMTTSWARLPERRCISAT